MSKSCKICKDQVHQWANYCTNCAFVKGICARCGRKISSGKHHVRRDTHVRKTEEVNATILAAASTRGNDVHKEEDEEEEEVKQPLSKITTTTQNTETQQDSTWRKLTDARGNTYYYNAITNKTSWTKPTKEDEEAEKAKASECLENWKEAKDQYGRTYYYNTITNETSWNLPTTTTTKTTTQQNSFIPSQKFTSERKGYYFAMGDMGLGYYLDDKQNTSST